ncbi:MAG: hypothetical protein H5T45_04265 [Thermoplasmatales archaeon]|nr:hypothetical protein [Thermoplasmatales archaeon]
MRIYIGTFNEKEADEVVDDLKKAGVGCDIRSYLNTLFELEYFVEGYIKDLKEKYKEGFVAKVISDAEKNIEIAREIFKEGMDTKYFDSIFLEKSVPERKNYEEIERAIKEIMGVEEKMPIFSVLSKNLDEKKDEIAKKIGEENFKKYMLHLLKEIDILADVHLILGNNGIEYREGKMYGKINETPFIRRYFDVDEEEAKKLGLKKEYTIEVFKDVDVYANMVDVIYEVGRVRKLCNEKQRYGKLLFILSLVDEIIGKLKGKKLSINEIIEDLGEIYRKDEKMEEEIFIEEEAIREILKVMEKAEIIKIKNEKVMLKE